MKQPENKNVFGGTLNSLQKNTNTSISKELVVNSSAFATEVFIKTYGINPLSIIPFNRTYDYTDFADFNDLIAPNGTVANQTFFGSIDISAVPFRLHVDQYLLALIGNAKTLDNVTNGKTVLNHLIKYRTAQHFQTTVSRVEMTFAHTITLQFDDIFLLGINFNGFLIQH
jgi:hypothetical protein